jgi:hypothetical protein
LNHRCTVVRNLGEGAPWGFGQILLRVVLGEGVRTSKIRTSKGQNVKSIFRMIRVSQICWLKLPRLRHSSPSIHNSKQYGYFVWDLPIEMFLKFNDMFFFKVTSSTSGACWRVPALGFDIDRVTLTSTSFPSDLRVRGRWPSTTHRREWPSLQTRITFRSCRQMIPRWLPTFVKE